jgi:hypothetical protein
MAARGGQPRLLVGLPAAKARARAQAYGAAPAYHAGPQPQYGVPAHAQYGVPAHAQYGVPGGYAGGPHAPNPSMGGYGGARARRGRGRHELIRVVLWL